MSGSKKTGGRSLKGHPPSGDFFALGSKPLSGRQSSPNPTPPAKKPHLDDEEGGTLFSDPIRISQHSQTRVGVANENASSKLVTSGLVQPIEVRPTELVSAIEDSLDNPSKIDKLISGALKQLRNARLKVDVKLNEALKILILKHPQIFTTPSSIEGLLLVLKKEMLAIFKSRCEPQTYSLACNLLLIALKDSFDWPESVAKTYIEDAIGDRVWVDIPSCQKFIDNICTIFNTRKRESEDTGSDLMETGDGISKDTGGVIPKEEPCEYSLVSLISSVEIQPRFSLGVCRSLQTHVIQLVREILGRRGTQPSDVMLRNHLKFLGSACGIPEIRMIITEKFEQWILNSKMVKPVQVLLFQVAYNTHQHTSHDVKVLESLVNVTLKTRLFSLQYVACVKEFISSHPDNLETVMRKVVTNELGQSLRNPTNIQLITMMILCWADKSATLLSALFQEFLVRRDDYLKTLRGFLREIVRQVRCEKFPFVSFARGLMQDTIDITKLDQSMKEQLTMCLSDLISCCCMLSASILIREAYSGYSKGEKPMISVLKEFFDSLGLIQRDAVWWIHSVLPNTLRPQPADYRTCLRKVLFLETVDSYCSIDNWPSEAERGVIFQLMTEASLHDDTLMRILVIGLTRELPLPPNDALDIADKLVARAANVHTIDIPRIPTLDRKELFNAVFDVARYRPPPSIVLPIHYTPPDLAISKLYWKGWILLLVLSAFNPTTIGSIGWGEYPTLRIMMEMVMTQNYSLPEDTPAMEVKLSREEKELILEYETHLASSSSNSETSVTEASSYLLNHVTLLDPNGSPRRLLPSVTELIKTVNNSLRLGQLLCRCREPDFLLAIINRQGTNKAMNWLRELVEGSQSTLDVLPVSCLCEFLITGYQEKGMVTDSGTEGSMSSHRSQFKRKQRVKEKVLQQHEQIMERLQSLINGKSPDVCLEVLKYFLSKLSSSYSVTRHLALKALQEILSQDSQKWLTIGLPSLPTFTSLLTDVIPLIVEACRVETDSSHLVNYLLFISTNISNELLVTIAMQLSPIVCSRFSLLKTLSLDSSLLKIFRRSLDMFIHDKVPIPGDEHETEDLKVMCIPSVDKTCEIVIEWEFLNALWLLLSLNTSFNDEHYLINMLLPVDTNLMVRVVAMVTRESHPILDNGSWKYIVCGQNINLVERLVGVVSQDMLYIDCFGISVPNMNIILAEITKRGMACNDSLITLVKSNYLRGCTAAKELLKIWGHSVDNITIQDLLSTTVNSISSLNDIATPCVQIATPRDFTNVFSDSIITHKVLLYLLTHYDDTDTSVTEQLITLLSVIKKALGKRELDFIELSLIRVVTRLALKHGNTYSIDSLISSLTDINSVSKSATINNLIISLLRFLNPEQLPQHSSLLEAKQVLKTGRLYEFASPVSCDIKEILDPELHYNTGSITNTYFLEKSIHQTSIQTVCKLIVSIVDNKNIQDSAVVLNYLLACLHCPSLWQGKVKKEPVITSYLGLELSWQRLICLVDHMLRDAKLLYISLLTSCCNDQMINNIAQYLSSLSSSKSHDLIYHLYHSDQSIVKYVPTTQHIVLDIPAKLDTEIYYILHAMNNISNVECLNSAGMLCRHIAITHPLILLRHLPLIGSLLRGKAFLSQKQFQQSNYHHVFNNAFHLLQLLQPLIFSMPHDILSCCLNPFMEFMKIQCVDTGKSHSLGNKIITLLQQYCHHNRECGIHFILQHKNTLSSVTETFPKLKGSIQVLLSLMDTQCTKAMSPSETGQTSYEQLLPFLSKLEHGRPEESVLEVLQDLNDSSLRSVEILTHFVPELCRIIQYDTYSHTSLKLCHDLLIRYLRHSPWAIKNVLPHITNCLRSHDGSVVMATVASLPDVITLLSGQDAKMLLSTLFNLSVYSSADCNKYLTQSISVLTAHMLL